MTGFADAGERSQILARATEEALAVRGPLASTRGHGRCARGQRARMRCGPRCRALARGSVHVECGRPARPLAWVWLSDGILVVEIEARDVPGTEVEVGRYPPSPDGAADAARALSERLELDFACAQPVPLFIGCLATAPER